MNVAVRHPRCVLLEGEALATMRTVVRDKSIDLVCTDPPYGDHTHAMMGKEKRGDGVAISEELWFPPLTRDFVHALAAEFVRVCSGWIVIFTDDRTLGWWGEAIEAARGRWVRTGHWVKTNPKPQMSADRPAIGSECVIIGHSFPPGNGRMEWQGGGRAAIWRGPRDQVTLHPNQKPLWLMQELLGLFGKPGASVLDPFAGSGSTGVAAFAKERIPGLSPLDAACNGCRKVHAEHYTKRPPIPTGMSFLGIEVHNPTLDVAKDRLTAALEAL